MNTIAERISKDRVFGFLHTSNKTIVNGRNEQILLTGWGLGNWLNPEGYMWLSDSPHFTRGRDMEAAILRLTDAEYAQYFWKTFRERYITRADILRMAEEGYNSVRIPINWRLFMEETPGEPIWKDEGFMLLDQCIAWCREAGVYAFIDLHAAPGGQTGSNIDDCAHNRPELFTDPDFFGKGIVLWRTLAQRYKDEWIVGGYDILNEPLMPTEDGRYEALLPDLRRFYHEAIAAIRETDSLHMISLEGHHWSTSTEIFDERYDANLLIHFHRYACMPEKESIQSFLQVSEQWNAPLWLGESGENKMTWYAAFYPLMLSYGIGYNLWTWKKMETDNSPCSVRKPDGWEHLIDATKDDTAAKPSADTVKELLNTYLENMLLENCEYNKEVVSHAFRRPPCTLRAQDYDLQASDHAAAFHGHSVNTGCVYRRNLSIYLQEIRPQTEKSFFFDTQWDRYALTLSDGEAVSYLFLDVKENSRLEIHGVISPGYLHVTQDARPLTPQQTIRQAQCFTLIFLLHEAAQTRIAFSATGTTAAELLVLKNASDA